MTTVSFTAYYCGMCSETFSEQIMIYKPHAQYNQSFEFDDDYLVKYKVSDLIHKIKERAKEEKHETGEWENDRLNFSNIYIKTQDALLGLSEDKLLLDVFDFFNVEKLEFAFFIAGGASLHSNGYVFVVHPNEDIHRFKPHVHVKRNDEETRYSLETLERFPQDTFSRTFRRDEKKKIIPFLEGNKERLLEWWNLYMNGYIPPVQDENGRQYYKES